MAGLLAHARARGALRSVVLVLVATAVMLPLAAQDFGLPGFRQTREFTVPLANLLPVLSAVVLGTTLWSPVADWESLASRRLWPYRLTVQIVLALLACTGAAVLAAVAQLPMTLLVRNTLAYLGLTWATSLIVGAGLSWVAPTGALGLLIFLGVGADNTPSWWALPLMPVGNLPAALGTAVLTIAGLAVVALRRPRVAEVTDEA